eukprot:CAMPEP_0172720322 /NCGR_PEP_ID=MMETSP1074-20121228/76627_1 /TAXON_ID=2916 /ORGANISM="Ceratium fusus, Strain PA161109" /LENGTH=41 /DNA_ID= /DNA_START= /DNA_END= /DNA_ORIENTATION=
MSFGFGGGILVGARLHATDASCVAMPLGLMADDMTICPAVG